MMNSSFPPEWRDSFRLTGPLLLCVKEQASVLIVQTFNHCLFQQLLLLLCRCVCLNHLVVVCVAVCCCVVLCGSVPPPSPFTNAGEDVGVENLLISSLLFKGLA